MAYIDYTVILNELPIAGIPVALVPGWELHLHCYAELEPGDTAEAAGIHFSHIKARGGQGEALVDALAIAPFAEAWLATDTAKPGAESEARKALATEIERMVDDGDWHIDPIYDRRAA